MLSSVDAIVEALGGPSAARALAGAEHASAVSNWKKRGKIPAELFVRFSDELERLGKSAPDPAAFTFKEPAEARA